MLTVVLQASEYWALVFYSLYAILAKSLLNKSLHSIKHVKCVIVHLRLHLKIVEPAKDQMIFLNYYGFELKQAVLLFFFIGHLRKSATADVRHLLLRCHRWSKQS